MYWNYRVIYHKDQIKDYYAIHEVYYVDNLPKYWTLENIEIYEYNVPDLKSVLERMQQALTRPVLEIEGSTLIERQN